MQIGNVFGQNCTAKIKKVLHSTAPYSNSASVAVSNQRMNNDAPQPSATQCTNSPKISPVPRVFQRNRCAD